MAAAKTRALLWVLAGLLLVASGVIGIRGNQVGSKRHMFYWGSNRTIQTPSDEEQLKSLDDMMAQYSSARRDPTVQEMRASLLLNIQQARRTSRLLYATASGCAVLSLLVAFIAWRRRGSRVSACQPLDQLAVAPEQPANGRSSAAARRP